MGSKGRITLTTDHRPPIRRPHLNLAFHRYGIRPHQGTNRGRTQNSSTNSPSFVTMVEY